MKILALTVKNDFCVCRRRGTNYGRGSARDSMANASVTYLSSSAENISKNVGAPVPLPIAVEAAVPIPVIGYAPPLPCFAPTFIYNPDAVAADCDFIDNYW